MVFCCFVSPFSFSSFSNAALNRYSSSDSDSLIFTGLYLSALLNTTPTEAKSESFASKIGKEKKGT